MTNLISTKKNLLAFSGGVDSSALFFMLNAKQIDFDIAIVDYNQRKNSKAEILYAQELAAKYNKKCFLKTYQNKEFSEKLARDFRYRFFEEIIKDNGYDSLITAHQLNDKFEWFLMQLSKGAGLIELIGLKKIESREFYTLYRPLLEVSKDELLEYLHKNKIKYFIDKSNSDPKYKRNFFRHRFSEDFIKLYKDGLINSFSYLEKDVASLISKYDKFVCQEFLLINFYSNDENLIIRAIDKELKKRGIVISSKTRKEILAKKSVVVSHKICIEIINNFLIIAPFRIQTMDKKMKEKFRINKIPKNLRGYIYELESDNIEKIFEKIKLLKCFY